MFEKSNRDRVYIGAFALTLISFVLALSLYHYTLSKNILLQQITNRLTSIQSVRKMEIEQYFNSISNYLRTQTFNPSIRNAITEFDEAYKELESESLSKVEMRKLRDYYERDFLQKLRQHQPNAIIGDYLPGDGEVASYLQYHYIANNSKTVKNLQLMAEDGSDYSILHASYHEFFKKMNLLLDFYDVFLINIEGEVIYSVEKEIDFATNLRTGQHKNSGIARLFNRLLYPPDKDNPLFQDFSFYAPSASEPAAFAGQLVFDSAGEAIGALVVQISDEKINQVMSGEQLLLGKSGEAILIGTKDQLIRSDSHLHQDDPETFYKQLRNQYAEFPDAKIEIVINQIINYKTPISLLKIVGGAAEAINKDMAGYERFPDYRGIDVFGAYSPLDIGNGLEWGIIVKQDVEDALSELDVLIVDILTTISIFLLFLVPLLVMFYNHYHLPIRKLTRLTSNLNQGRFPSPRAINAAGELGGLAMNIETLSSSMQTTNRNISKIARGDLDIETGSNDLVNVAINDLVSAQRNLLTRQEDTEIYAEQLHDFLNEHLNQLEGLSSAIGQQVAEIDEEQKGVAYSFRKLADQLGQSGVRKEVHFSQSRSVSVSLSKLKTRIDEVNKSLVGYQRILGSVGTLLNEDNHRNPQSSDTGPTLELLISQFEANLALNWTSFDAVKTLLNRVVIEAGQLTDSLAGNHASDEALLEQLPDIRSHADLNLQLNKVFSEINLLSSRLAEYSLRDKSADS